MGDPAEQRCDDLLRSGAAAAWRERLTAAFFDAEARRAIIGQKARLRAGGEGRGRQALG